MFQFILSIIAGITVAVFAFAAGVDVGTRSRKASSPWMFIIGLCLAVFFGTWITICAINAAKLASLGLFDRLYNELFNSSAVEAVKLYPFNVTGLILYVFFACGCFFLGFYFGCGNESLEHDKHE